MWNVYMRTIFHCGFVVAGARLILAGVFEVNGSHDIHSAANSRARTCRRSLLELSGFGHPHASWEVVKLGLVIVSAHVFLAKAMEFVGEGLSCTNWEEVACGVFCFKCSQASISALPCLLHSKLLLLKVIVSACYPVKVILHVLASREVG